MKKIFTLLLLIAFGFTAEAQTVSLAPAKDNSIYSDNTSNSSGIGQLYCGRTCGSGNRRALMQFDVSSIPAGAVVSSVTLTVNVNNVSAGGGTSIYNIYALTNDFGEGASNGGGSGATAIAPDATWNDAMLGTSVWTLPGGDYIPTSLSAVSMNTSNGDKVFATEVNFVNTVQAWINTPASNFGMIMIGNETTTCTARRFGSKNVGTAPVLSITYAMPCSGPTALCQDIDIFLDGSGTATILGADLDGGSTDDCNTGSLQFDASQTAFTCADIGSAGTGGLIISGVYDGPLTAGTPKGVELYASTAIADLSNYGIGSANNGGGTDGEEFTFPAVAVPAGTYIYVTTDSAQFNAFFGFDADYFDGSMAINGDDAIELFQNGAVIDVFGDIGLDGTGQPWEYQDGWAYRNNLQGTNGGVFTSTNWMYSGPNALDNETSNGTAVTPFPTGSFMPAAGAVSVTLTVTDGLGNMDVCTAFVSVLDTILPMPDMVTLADETEECEVTSLMAPTATDNCAGPITATTTTTFPITTTTTVTWIYNDGNGNSVSQNQNVIISDATAPVPNTQTLPQIIAPCEVTPTIPTATDNCSSIVDASSTTSFPVTATTTITWSYDDGNGNISTQDQDIVITGFIAEATLSGGILTASASGLNFSFQWIDCADSSSIVGATSNMFTPSSPGDYAVIITTGSCSETSPCVTVTTGNVNEIEIDLGMSVSPNPSSGLFNVSFENTVSGIITIIDANGRLIQTQELNGNSLLVDLKSVQSGLYLMNVTTENGVSRTRLVKQ